MTPRPKKPWSTLVTVQGVTVRVYEREAGGPIYREVRLDGRRDRKALGHSDRALAAQQATALATRLAELRHAGHSGPVTLGQCWRLYQQHRFPLLSVARQTHVRQHARFLLEHFGDAFRLDDLTQTGLDAFAAARKAGTLRAKNRPNGARTVRDGTIRQNLNWLAALLRWARGHRVEGRRLLAANPLEGLTLPQEKNPKRPVATEERYTRTLAAAPRVDPSGRLACMLALARYTGRRVNAICSLRASDLALSPAAVRRALAAAGDDAARAVHIPHGAIRWRAETDKLGYEELTPLSRGAREALDAYLRAHPRVGDVPLFPDLADATQATNKMEASYLLTRAESAAGVEKLARGLWHPYRRLWASERKHLPDPDVAKAGGWRDLATMKRSYQQADPATTLAVVENAPPKASDGRSGRESASDGHISDTPYERSDDAATA